MYCLNIKTFLFSYAEELIGILLIDIPRNAIDFSLFLLQISEEMQFLVIEPAGLYFLLIGIISFLIPSLDASLSALTSIIRFFFSLWIPYFTLNKVSLSVSNCNLNVFANDFFKSRWVNID